MLSENNKNISTMRILVALIVIVFLFNWTYITIKTGAWVVLDSGSVLAIIGALSAKAVQKKIENGVELK
jgi:hypothetical protein